MTTDFRPAGASGPPRPRVALSRPGLPGGALGTLGEIADVVQWTGAEPPSATGLQELAAGCSGLLLLGSDRVDAGLLAAAGEQLQVVALASMGYDAVDLAAVSAHGTVATHTPGVLAETTADLTFALILWARRRLRAAERTLLDGGWTAFRMGDLLGLDVHGARLGLLGFGQIGQAVARRAQGFGMPVRHHTRSGQDGGGLSQAVGFDELIETSDVLSVHVPLTPATRGLIGAGVLARMKPGATLVNTARGGVVDEDALLTALRTGQLHSAGLDVMEHEPRSNPADPLFTEGRLVVLPHVGSATERTRAAMADLAAANIAAVLQGRPAPTPIPGTPARPAGRGPA